MISTVTISTITTVTTIAAMGLGMAVGAGIVGTLIAFLVTKELTGASQSITAQLSARFLNVSIVPMAIVFAVILAVKVAEILI